MTETRSTPTAAVPTVYQPRAVMGFDATICSKAYQGLRLAMMATKSMRTPVKQIAVLTFAATGSSHQTRPAMMPTTIPTTVATNARQSPVGMRALMKAKVVTMAT